MVGICPISWLYANPKRFLVGVQPENFVLRSESTPWSERGLVLIDHGFAVRTDSAEFALTQRTYELARGTALYLTHELAEYVVNGTSSSPSRISYSYPVGYLTGKLLNC